MALHNELGVLGEKIALEYLKNKGYKILDINWICGHKEVDIIAKDGDILVFVEIKTRRSTYLIDPEVSVDVYKQNNLIWAANNYVNNNKLDMDVRFDIISIVVNNNNEKKIEHIENAFYPVRR